ncbi:MAG: hypothetical protein WED01_11970 [Candidatus Rokuibacteriota bacterium]
MVEALRRMFWSSPYTAVIEEVRAFQTLPAGWNSHRAPRVTEGAVKAALEILYAADRRHAPVPSAAPTSLGGVALSWEIGEIEAQLLIDEESIEYSVARRGSPKVMDQGSFVHTDEVEKHFIERYLISRR